MSLNSGYNIPLVILSVAIAMIAAYASLDLAGRVTATKGRAQWVWISAGAAAMGIGIWSMHFVGMLAFRLPLVVRYEFWRVVVSVFPAAIASGLVLFLISRPSYGWWSLIGGAVLIGSGIASMHYLGMAAMQTTAIVRYDVRLIGVSIAAAIAVSLAGLYLAFQLRNQATPSPTRNKFVAAVLLGAAIPLVHYIGMAAVSFIPTADTIITEHLQPPENAVPLTAGVAVGTLIILGLTSLTVFFERRLSAQAIYAQALQNSQQYLKAILQGIQVGVIVIGSDRRIRLSNRAALDWLNLASESELDSLWEQAIAVTNSEVSPAASDWTAPLPELQAIFQSIAKGQPVQNAIVQIARADGSNTTSLLVNAVPLRDSQAAAEEIIVTIGEVTELKQTEQRLKDSEAQFKDLAQQAEILNHLSAQVRQSLDLQTILQTTVREVRQFFTADRVAIYRFDERWYGQVVLEDVAEPWISTLGETADDCFPQHCLEHYQSGFSKAINDTATATLAPEHAQFLQRLQVRANLIVPILVRDELWGLLIVHQCSGSRVWRDSESNLLSRLAIQLGIAIQQADLYAQSKHSAEQANFRAQQLRQSELQLKQQAEALQQDLQELQSLQLQLVQSEKMSSLGQLVAGIAHEINNPINFIHGNLIHLQNYISDLLSILHLYQSYYPEPVPEIQAKSEAVDLAFLQEDSMQMLKSMQVGTQRISQIVLSLRTFSRVDESDSKVVDIHEGIDSALAILDYRLKDQTNFPPIDVVRDYGELPLVQCFPGLLNQAFMNLLSNAIDAIESARMTRTADTDSSGSDSIRIRTDVVGEQWVRIAIADTGCGIPDTVRAKIFDPFFTTKPIGKGTGLGLSLSYWIVVEKHRGTLNCIATLPQGTGFIVQIPLRQDFSEC